MTTAAQSIPTPRNSLFILDSIGRLYRRSRTYSRVFRELDALTDRELLDIGIHRAMISEVARQSAAEA